ncbi:hypothetical protein Ddye_014915 [Dipteronia dyeriana]|uniref:Uncharacterized protein n=1 Tax=Dipteronia dyeriana TaxID=168575 RepID=A0AAD9U3Y1_9ROSI|nr:hypothetical protein Ddye_014915 [Dipteronia dyeriana]
MRSKSFVKMGKWRGWLCIKQSFYFTTNCVLSKITSSFRPKKKGWLYSAVGSRDVLLSLYKDLESCQEYEDIQVMWELIHSSCPSKKACKTRRNSNKKRPFHWKFCFRQT